MLVEIGRITRPHGLHGEVIVILVSNRLERLASGSILTTDSGDLTVVSARPHGQRHIVAFEDITTRNQAEEYRSLILRAEPLQDLNELWVHELIGSEVVDQFGISRSTVDQVIANPASDLLELTNGALVPVCFITDFIPHTQVTVTVPEGLFESS